MIKVTGADGIKYIIDGERYWPEEALKEAIGCKDDDIFGEIKKLKEERERYKSNCDYFAGIAQDRLRDRNKLELGLREALGTVDEYADVIGLVRKLKEERDALKEKCDKMKKRANATYGVSCGYSASKQPAFLCNVISYRMDEPSYPIRNDTIRVELDLTPTANYKGAFDLEDLKKYIQEYGREKKLSDFETLCKLVDNCIDELCDKYNVVQPDRSLTTRERFDYIFAVLADYRDLADDNYNKVEGFRKEKRAVEDSLAELRAKIREIYRSVFCNCRWEDGYSYCSALNEIKEEYERVKYFFTEENDELKEVKKEYSRYRLAVNSLLDIPKDIRDDINAIERAFTFSKREYKSLKEFRDNVCEILDIPSSMADKQVLKEIHDFADRYYELNDFRADILKALDLEKDPPRYECTILDILNHRLKALDHLEKFRTDIAEVVGMNREETCRMLLASVKSIKDSAVDKDEYDKQKELVDRLARLRSNVCTALCLGGETSDEDILNAITKMREEGNKLARLRSNICSEFSLVPENCDGNIIGHIHMMQDCHDKLREFRDAVAKAIGMDYPTTNQVILNNVQYIYKDRKDAYDIVAKLHDHVTELEKQVKGFTKRCDSLEDLQRDLWKLRRNAIEDLKSRGFCFRPEENETLPEIYDKLLKRYDLAYGGYKEQYRLRQMWHVRWESENERANGEHKRAEKLRKDVTALTNHIELLKLTNASQENSIVASQAFKNECRKLKEEKAKVIAALGQDIWDDCVK